MERQANGVCLIPCKVNDIPLKFVFDTGASSVVISITEAQFLLKNGYIYPSDIKGTTHVQLANGEIVENTVVILRKVEIGGIVLRNITASITNNSDAPLLLGQSVIQELGPIQINKDKLIIFNGQSSTQMKNNQNNKNQSNLRTNKANNINRNIGGIVLGRTTKQEVIKHLILGGDVYELHEPNENYSIIVSNGNFEHLGVEWQAVSYKLYKDKVFSIFYFLSGENTKLDAVTRPFTSYTHVLRQLRNKYESYYTFDEQNDMDIFDDGYISIIIKGGSPKAKQQIIFMYQDNALFKQFKDNM